MSVQLEPRVYQPNVPNARVEVTLGRGRVVAAYFTETTAFMGRGETDEEAHRTLQGLIETYGQGEGKRTRREGREGRG
jgi:hypothetical protein